MLRTSCACGGAWSAFGPQQLVELDGTPHDVFEAQCGACSQATVFEFDVSSFFGHKEAVARWVSDLLPEATVQVRGRIERKVGPPLMTKVISLVRQLSTDRDLSTLQYLAWRIDRAVSEAARGSSQTPE